jgi:hypothetical protein
MPTTLNFLSTNYMALALLVIAFLVLIVLWLVQRRKDNFDLRWVIADEQTKQPSIHKVGQLTALIMSTWLLVYLTLHDKMDGTYFTTYMAIWAGAQVANKYLSTRDRDERSDPSVEVKAPEDPASASASEGPQDWTRR